MDARVPDGVITDGRGGPHEHDQLGSCAPANPHEDHAGAGRTHPQTPAGDAPPCPRWSPRGRPRRGRIRPERAKRPGGRRPDREDRRSESHKEVAPERSSAARFRPAVPAGAPPRRLTRPCAHRKPGPGSPPP
jgi:hypothetical protein